MNQALENEKARVWEEYLDKWFYPDTRNAKPEDNFDVWFKATIDFFIAAGEKAGRDKDIKLIQAYFAAYQGREDIPDNPITQQEEIIAALKADTSV